MKTLLAEYEVKNAEDKSVMYSSYLDLQQESIVETEFESFTLDLLSTRFIGNTYVNLSLGVASDATTMNKMHRGSLIKLNQIMTVDFQDETFINVGSFTVEHFQAVLSKIKNEVPSLRETPPMVTSYGPPSNFRTLVEFGN